MQLNELNLKLSEFPFFVDIAIRKMDGCNSTSSKECLREVNDLSSYGLDGDDDCFVLIIDQPDDTGFVAFEQVDPHDPTTWRKLRRDPFQERYCREWKVPLYSIRGLDTTHIDL